MSTHIYALQKGLYGSSHDSVELTRAQSLPTQTPQMQPSESKPAQSVFTADQQRFMLKNSHTDFLVLDCHATGRAIGRNNKMLFSEQQPINDNYMAVIRDSHAAVLSRHELRNERQKILDLDTGCDTRIWNQIKRRKMH